MDFSNWKWLNESNIDIKDGSVTIDAPAETDWFVNPLPTDGKMSPPVANAPFFYTEVEGDFVFEAKVTPFHESVYDACALMVIENDRLWAKAAFEKTDFGTKAAVCVVTDGVSDDCNGADIDADQVRLRLLRKGNVFSVLYSKDGRNYRMVRLFTLNVPSRVKVGLEAQSPAGKGGKRLFEEISLEARSVKDPRAGE